MVSPDGRGILCVHRVLTDVISSIPTVGFAMKRVKMGSVTLKWYVGPPILYAFGLFFSLAN
jgi:hypothetical protein